MTAQYYFDKYHPKVKISTSIEESGGHIHSMFVELYGEYVNLCTRRRAFDERSSSVILKEINGKWNEISSLFKSADLDIIVFDGFKKYSTPK